jgi:hypothetical protein
MSSPTGAAPLPGPQLERLVERMRWREDSRTAGGTGGSAVGWTHGAEFELYRAYQPGDDLRRLDAKIFARLRRRVVRVTRSDHGLPITLLIDRTASIQGMDGRSRDVAIERLARVFMAISLQQSNPIRVLCVRESSLLAWPLPHPMGVDALRAGFEKFPLAGDDGDLRRAFQALPPHPSGRGLTIWLTDGWGLCRPETQLAPLTRHGSVTVACVCEPSELDPGSLRIPMGRPVTLRARESEPAWHGRIDAPALAAYANRLSGFHGGLRRRLRALGGDCIVLHSGMSEASMVEALAHPGRLLKRARG